MLLPPNQPSFCRVIVTQTSWTGTLLAPVTVIATLEAWNRNSRFVPLVPPRAAVKSENWRRGYMRPRLSEISTKAPAVNAVKPAGALSAHAPFTSESVQFQTLLFCKHTVAYGTTSSPVGAFTTPVQVGALRLKLNVVAVRPVAASPVNAAAPEELTVTVETLSEFPKVLVPCGGTA